LWREVRKELEVKEIDEVKEIKELAEATRMRQFWWVCSREFTTKAIMY